MWEGNVKTEPILRRECVFMCLCSWCLLLHDVRCCFDCQPCIQWIYSSFNAWYMCLSISRVVPLAICSLKTTQCVLFTLSFQIGFKTCVEGSKLWLGGPLRLDRTCFTTLCDWFITLFLNFVFVLDIKLSGFWFCDGKYG